jgi:hypothetical protein
MEAKNTNTDFIVGEIFQHKNYKTSNIPFLFGNDYFKEFWASAQFRKISVSVVGKNILKGCDVSDGMNSIKILDANGSSPMNEDQFWATLFLLTIEPKLGKKILKYKLQFHGNKVYIFHINKDSGNVIAVRIGKLGDHWCLDGSNDGDFGIGTVVCFLSPTM